MTLEQLLDYMRSPWWWISGSLPTVAVAVLVFIFRKSFSSALAFISPRWQRHLTQQSASRARLIATIKTDVNARTLFYLQQVRKYYTSIIQLALGCVGALPIIRTGSTDAFSILFTVIGVGLVINGFSGMTTTTVNMNMVEGFGLTPSVGPVTITPST